VRTTWQKIVTLLTFVAMATACGAPSEALPQNISGSSADSVTSVPTKPVTTSRPDSKASFSGTSFPLTVTDWYGKQSAFEEKPKRVAIITGTAFNIWYDVGGEAIGTTNRSENIRLMPEVAAALAPLPELGAPHTLDQEKLVALNPDLVISMGSSHDQLASNLRGMGVNVIQMTLRNQDDVFMAYEMFGAINGNHDKAVQRIEQIASDVADIKAKFPVDEHRKIAIIYVTAQSLSVKLDNSIAGNIAKTLGLENVATGRTPDAPGSEHTPLDIEYLAKTQPDEILVTSMIANNEEAKARLEASFASNAAWQAVDAVRAGRVHYLPQQYFLFNAGPYYADAVEYLAAAIHPEIYGEPTV